MSTSEKIMEETKNQEVKVQEEEATVTPWEVKGKVNYMAQIQKFGTEPIDGKLIERWEKVTKCKVHHFIRRGLVFSNQDINKILDLVEAGVPIYIYTGRGPSSESMHTGHLVPFILTRYLQKALNCIVVIQMSDDEKFLFKGGSKPKDLDHYRQLSYKNARDIIACGFDPTKTYIFSNLETNADDLYFNNTLILKSTNMNQIKGTYGLGETLPENVLELLKSDLADEKNKNSPDQNLVDAIEATLKKFSGQSAALGQCAWPAFQCGPAFATSFRKMFIKALEKALSEKADTLPEHVGKNMKRELENLKVLGKNCNIGCLVPMAIDQAPYFRMARDVAGNLMCPKPAVIHSEFLPGLKQSNGKMSSTMDAENSTLFLDMDIQSIKDAIKKYAFSGGRQTKKEHQEMGGDPSIDICYQYLTYFMDDDQKLKEIAQSYADGDLLSGQLKQMTADVVGSVIEAHQTAKAALTEEDVRSFFDASRTLDVGGCYDRPDLEDSSHSDFDTYGIDFDRTFGIVPKCKRGDN